MSLVGTIKKNKRYIPNEFKASKNREILSTEFGFGPKTVLCSYVPKKDKAVILLSTLHRDKTVSGPQKKPEIIHYYNQTKGGVDTMDKMLSQYTTKRRTNRWPLAVFYNLLDIASLAAYIIYTNNNPQGDGAIKNSQRRKFLQYLGEQLCIPLIKIRSQNRRVVGKFRIRSAIECILGESISSVNDEEFLADQDDRDVSGRIKQKGACYSCYQQQKRKRATRHACVKCRKPVCVEHSYTQTKCEPCYMN